MLPVSPNQPTGPVQAAPYSMELAAPHLVGSAYRVCRWTQLDWTTGGPLHCTSPCEELARAAVRWAGRRDVGSRQQGTGPPVALASLMHTVALPVSCVACQGPGRVHHSSDHQSLWHATNAERADRSHPQITFSPPGHLAHTRQSLGQLKHHVTDSL